MVNISSRRSNALLGCGWTAAYQQKLARDAEDDFNKVFGREFMGTYMAQVKRLKSGG